MNFKLKDFKLNFLLGGISAFVLISGCGTFQETPQNKNIKIGISSPENPSVSNLSSSNQPLQTSSIQTGNIAEKSAIPEGLKLEQKVVTNGKCNKIGFVAKPIIKLDTATTQRKIDSLRFRVYGFPSDHQRLRTGKIYGRLGLALSIPGVLFPIIINLVALYMCVYALSILKKHEVGYKSAQAGVVFSILSLLFMCFILYLFLMWDL